MCYLQAVVLETLRLRPPAYIVGRCAAIDVTLGSHQLPKGITIAVPSTSPMQIMRSASHLILMPSYPFLLISTPPGSPFPYPLALALPCMSFTSLFLEVAKATSTPVTSTTMLQRVEHASMCRNDSFGEPMGDASGPPALATAGGISARAMAGPLGSQASHGRAQ